MAPGADEVEVWRVPLTHAARTLPDRLRVLDAEERRRASRLREPSEFVMVRSALRAILGRALGRSARDVPIGREAGGRPVLEEPTDLDFNVSHTRGMALIAVARGRRVGVDLEARDADPVLDASTLARALTPAERALVLSAPDPDAAFLRRWTLKEALLKARGTGLAEPLDDLDVPTETGGWIDGYRLTTLHVGSGYAAALAVASGPRDPSPSVTVRDAWA